MKRLLALLLFCAVAVTAGASAYHADDYQYDRYDYGYDYERYSDYYDYGDHYADRYYYDDPIYVDYNGLGRDGYRCIGSGCYATDYIYARYAPHGYGGYGGYGCRAYWCNEHWNEDYEYIVPPAYRGRSYPYWY